MRDRSFVPFAGLCALLLTLCAATPDAPIAVNSFLDLPDADLGDGVADVDLVTPGLQTTLRAAIQQANADIGAETIDLPAGTWKLTLKGSSEDAAATGDLDITDDLTIVGAGAATTIVDGGKLKDRVFDVRSGTVDIGGLTVQKGHPPKGETGGGVRNAGGTLALHDATVTHCASHEDAGGVDTRGGGSTLTDVLILKNSAKVDGGGMGADGGDVDLLRVTIASNRSGGGGGGFEDFGQNVGAINTTITGNKAKRGGAIAIVGGGFVGLQNCTLARNKAPHGSGLADDDETEGSNTCVTQNTIFANKKTTNSVGFLLSLGDGNLDTGTTCGFGVGNLSNTDPMLGKLADNGGPTPTMALDPASPAVDGGNDNSAPTTDQRKLDRVDVQGVGTALTDIGAYEFEPRG